MPKSSAALGFGFELLNSGERFRAIMTLLFDLYNFEVRCQYGVARLCNKHLSEFSGIHFETLLR